ncbi:MAG: lysophospholipid acyltransferase family protein [Planctomycetes bacterium]|nr:lysophospholipid acyltransferase family protein [Planctomycetota bacterium]
MAKPPKLMDIFFGMLFRIFINVLLALPTRWIYRFIGTVSIFAYKLSRRHTRFSRLNLRMCFPSLFNPTLDMDDASDVRLERFIRRNYRQMFWAYVEGFIGNRKNTRSSIHKHLRLVVHEETRKLLAEKLEELSTSTSAKGVIFNVGHAGSWEIIGHTMSCAGIPLNVVARPLDIETINAEVDKTRERFGMRISSKFGGMVAMTRSILKGESLMLAIDQDAGIKASGIYANFFGHWCKCIESYALLALRYNVPIIPAYGYRHGEDFKFTMVWGKPIYAKGNYKNLNDVYRVVQDWHDVFAAQLLRYPYQYEWFHKKWRTRPADEENVQKPYELDKQPKKEKIAVLRNQVEKPNKIEKILEYYKEHQSLFENMPGFGTPYNLSE